MNTHELHLNSASFESIAERRKTIECRLLDEKRKSINIGDELVFINANDKNQTIGAVVVALHYADTFHQLFINESCQNSLQLTSPRLIKTLIRFTP